MQNIIVYFVSPLECFVCEISHAVLCHVKVNSGNCLLEK